MRNIKGHKASKIQETTKVVEHVLQRDENIHRKKRDTNECAEDEEAQSANEEIQRIVGRSFELKDLTGYSLTQSKRDLSKQQFYLNGKSCIEVILIFLIHKF